MGSGYSSKKNEGSFSLSIVPGGNNSKKSLKVEESLPTTERVTTATNRVTPQIKLTSSTVGNDIDEFHDSLPKIKFISFDNFRTLDSFRKFDEIDSNLFTNSEQIDNDNAFIVYISHNWIYGE